MHAYPIRPKPDDKRFTNGLLFGVADLLVDAGYPAASDDTTGADLLRLRLALYRFLYGDPE